MSLEVGKNRLEAMGDAEEGAEGREAHQGKVPLLPEGGERDEVGADEEREQDREEPEDERSGELSRAHARFSSPRRSC